MRIMNEELILQVLSFYPEDKRDLIEHQIREIEKIIQENTELYSKDKGYQKALDLILKNIIEGRFILKK